MEKHGPFSQPSQGRWLLGPKRPGARAAFPRRKVSTLLRRPGSEFAKGTGSGVFKTLPHWKINAPYWESVAPIPGFTMGYNITAGWRSATVRKDSFHLIPRWNIDALVHLSWWCLSGNNHGQVSLLSFEDDGQSLVIRSKTRLQWKM